MLLQQPAIKSILRGIVLWAPLWIGTTIVFGGLGGLYAFLVKKDTFLASQALLVRDEANATMMRLGRFESQTQLKAAQETILEMSKNRQVIRDALVAVKPKSMSTGWFSFGSSKSPFPSDSDIEEFAKYNVSVHAPKGVEFGATEVIYLDVKANSQADALKLVKAVSQALDTRLGEVRGARASSIISELESAKQVAQKELAATTERIKEMETQVGSELSDLRGMTETVGAGAPRGQIDQIMGEKRTAQAQLDQLLADQRLLEEALANPSSYVVAPGSLLNSQPALKKLREGLVEAQLNISALKGRFTDAHPLVVAAHDAQGTIERRLIDSLEASRITLVQDIQTSQKRIEELDRQRAIVEERLNSLASVRTQYANLISELKTRSTILEETERQLSEAYASKESATKVSLLTLLDEAQVSEKPLGPGRTTITGLCAIGGLLLGLGFVFAVTPIDGMPRFGRRWSDKLSGDQRSEAEPPTTERRGKTAENPTESRANERLAAIARTPARRNDLVRDTKTSPALQATNESERSKKLESLLAPDAEYTQAEDVASDETSDSGLTILERLAKAQEVFEERKRTEEREVPESNPSRSGPPLDTMPDRRNRPRSEVVANAPVQASYRGKN